MAGKMSPKFVVLSTLAVGAIYASGYAISSNSGQAMAAAPSANSAGQTASSTGSPKTHTKSTTAHHSKKPASHHTSGSNSTSTSSGSTSSSSRSTSSSKPSKPAVDTTPKYLNGTYNGAASNQIGTVEVAVTIENDKITNVQITGCYTHYPEDYIAQLPGYVVAHQTDQGPIVSGATLSSDDFYGAVQQAVAKAQNPNYKG